LKKQGMKPFFINDWLVLPAEGQLKRGDDIVHLEPKTMEMLVYFSKRPGEVITRDEFEQEVWHGTLIGYDAITGTVIKLRKALQDKARKPDFIATIPKRGYQLIATVQYTEQSNSFLQEASTKLHPVDLITKNWWSALFSVSFLFIVALIAFQFQNITENHQMPTGSTRSIAILPFDNLSNDPRQENLAVGITEDIITDLSRLSQLIVISSSASNIYKGGSTRPQTIGADLKVDYILRGGVRPIGEVVRVNVQLIDTHTGINKWGESYDRKLNELFAIQSEVTNEIVSFFNLKLTKQEIQRLSYKTTNNLIAYDHFQEGQRISRTQTQESQELAKISYRKAIEADPNYGRAYGSLAYLLAHDFRRGWTDSPRETLNHALELAKQGVELDSTIPQTFWSLGYVYLMRQEFANAEKSILQAIDIAPSYADGYGLLALIYNNMGFPEKAIENVTQGMRLNPYYTWDYLYNLGSAYYTLGRYDESIRELEKARDRNENAIPVRLSLAASYVRAGRQDDAEWEIEQIQLLNPSETITHIKQSVPILKKKLMKEFLDDLKKAGLPEH